MRALCRIYSLRGNYISFEYYRIAGWSRMEPLLCCNCFKEILGQEVLSEGRAFCSFECLGQDMARRRDTRHEAVI